MPVDWDAVQAISTGVGALLTGGALVVTFLLFRTEVKARRQSERHALKEQADRERAQARLISAWVTGPHGTADHGQIIAKVHVRNLSDEPIVAVLLEGLFEAEEDGIGGWRLREERLDALEMIPARDELDLTKHVRPVEDVTGDAVPSIRIEFTDAHGLRWTRWPDNSLQRVLEGV